MTSEEQVERDFQPQGGVERVAAVAPEGVRNSRRIAVWAFAGAILAGLTAWGVGESQLVRVDAEKVAGTVLGNPMEGSTPESEQRAELITAVRTSGLLGAALGLAFGLAGGLAGGSLGAGLKAGLIGLLATGAAGALVSAGAVPLYQNYRAQGEEELMASLALHGTMWAGVGGVAGLMLGLGAGLRKGRLLSLLVGGALGAAIGAVVYDMVGGVLFAGDATGDPVSASAVTRGLAKGLAALGCWAGAVAALGERRGKG